MKTPIDQLLSRAESLLQRLEALLSVPDSEPSWGGAIAFRWHDQRLRVITNPRALAPDEILCLDHQKHALDRNTRQFLHGLPANNALLWGSRGTGKSSLVKAMLSAYAEEGLRLVEIDRQHLSELPELMQLIEHRPERFILFCDDLSFEANDASYKQLKAALEGSLSGLGGNALIYATSNRRHLLPEYHSENQETQHLVGDHAQCEIHFSESVEEKISLSERFGLWLAFHPFTQDEYLAIVEHWLGRLGTPHADWESVRLLALRFALERGSRSGRVAWQFACDWSGRTRLDQLD